MLDPYITTIVSATAILLSFVSLLFGVIGVWQLLNEMRSRGKLAREELEHKKSVHRIEAQQWQARLNHEKYELQHFDRISIPIATAVAKQLSSDPSWVLEILDKTKIAPYANTVYGERSVHFKAEKEALAKFFTPVLLARLDCLREQQQLTKIFLIIDSGTTLHPFFYNLSSVLRGDQFKELRNVLTIITNNLPGLTEFIKNGRVLQGDGYSQLLVPCHLLPGWVLPQYAAVTGAETTAALESLVTPNGNKASRKCLIVSLVTGNWVRIRRTTPVCPVPLARGEGHLDLKQKALDLSDETYVVSPLGKIVLNKSLEDFNRLLGYSNGDEVLSSYRAYNEAFIQKEMGSRVKLVTTSRTQNRMILRSHCSRIQQKLGSEEGLDRQTASFKDATISSAPSLFVPFNLGVEGEDAQLVIEFPHPRTRIAEILRAFDVQYRDGEATL